MMCRRTGEPAHVASMGETKHKRRSRVWSELWSDGSVNRGENNIKIYLNEIWRDDIDSIKQIANKGQWRARVSTIMCFQIAWKAKDFLTRWAIVISSRRTRVHGVICLLQNFPNDYTCWSCNAYYDLHSEGAGFVSRPEYRLLWLIFFLGFLSMFQHISGN